MSQARILLCAVCGMIGLFQFGCASVPTTEELATADYGVRPGLSSAKTKAKSWILARLKDPGSAQIEWAPIEKAWFRQGGRKNRFAWRLRASVNAKNSYGGYAGARLWEFFFRGNNMVGLGEPYTHVGRYGVHTSITYIEMSGVKWPE